MLVTPLSVKQASSAILGAVKKELMAEVKQELRELLARHANDQVAEAVLSSTTVPPRSLLAVLVLKCLLCQH
jgi:hypothetical protein